MMAGLMVTVGRELCEIFSGIASRLLRQLRANVPFFPLPYLIDCFVVSDRGALHKAISYENGMHIIEETQLFPNFEPVQTLLLSSKKVSAVSITVFTSFHSSTKLLSTALS